MSRMDKAFIEAREKGVIRHKKFEEKDFYPIIDVARFYMPDAESSLVQTIFDNLRKELGQTGRAPTMEFKTADGSGALFNTVVQGAVVGQFRDLLLETYEDVRKKRDERAERKRRRGEEESASSEAIPTRLPVISGSGVVPFVDDMTSKIVDSGFPVEVNIGTFSKIVTSQMELDVIHRNLGARLVQRRAELEEANLKNEEKDRLILELRQRVAKLERENEEQKSCSFGALMELALEEEVAKMKTAAEVSMSQKEEIA